MATIASTRRRIKTRATGRGRLIRESKLSCIIHRAGGFASLPWTATRRLLNRKLLEFPPDGEIYRAHSVYVAEETFAPRTSLHAGWKGGDQGTLCGTVFPSFQLRTYIQTTSPLS